MQYIAYKFRLYPTENQKCLLAKHFGCARFVFNNALEEKIKNYKENKKSVSVNSLINQLKDLKNNPDYHWLREVNSQSLQSSLRNLDTAYQRFFKKLAKFPRLKKKDRKQSAIFPQNNKVDFENGKFFCMKFREGIKTKFHRTFEGRIKTCTISKTKTEKYFVSILVEEQCSEVIQKKIETAKTLGIDLGIKDFAVFSNGQKIKNPKFLNNKLKKLKRSQRKLSKSQKGGKNRSKRKLTVAKQHEKISNSRQDFIHKVTRKIVDNQDYNSYAVEDLNINGMIMNRKLSRQISDLGWGMFLTILKYKAERVGKNLIKIDRFFPSSKTCSNCGNVFKELTLNIRNWKCECCGTNHDRDINAAINIRNFAFRSINVLREPQKLTPVEDLTSGTERRNSLSFKSNPMKQEAPSFKAG